jgi:WD40 repeat protein
MKLLKKVASCVFLICLLSCYGAAQAVPSTGCTLEAPTFATNAANIFNDRQEQDLGDVLAEYFESDMRIAHPAADDQLTRIGERLLAMLPATGIHYRFRIYDSGEINGFSLAGGRVYISRKLIAAVKNEDELAGVIAHEIGHISTHQTAIEITRILRIRLGVTQVTDRADITARIHQLFSTPAKPNEDENTEEKGELTADRVALYAMARAGYAAESFPSFFNQVSLNKGKTGNKLSDFFGLTHEAAKRYRSALKLVEALPEGCKGAPQETSDAFSAWQRSTVEEHVKTVAEGLDGDKPLTLDPPLRPSLWRIRFSPDGSSLLAQDEAGISVLDRSTAKVLFRIDAQDVDAAQFAPDSKSVVFSDSRLRVEQWSVATQQRLSVKELVIFDGCLQTQLSPDGRTLVCAYMNKQIPAVNVGLRFIDVESGKTFLEKPGFFVATVSTPEAMWRHIVYGRLAGIGMMSMLTSPDGKYLLLVAGDSAMAYDLQLRQPVPLAGKLKELSQTRMSFLGPGQLYAVVRPKGNGMHVARILSFPEGKVITETEIGEQEIEGVTKGSSLIVRPLKDYAVGLFDPLQQKVFAATKLSAIDAWENFIAMEDGTGGVVIGQMGVPGSQKIPLPLAPLLFPRAGVFSPDGKYLAVSMKNRAVIWDLATGKQVKMTRPFRSAWMDDKDQLFGQFPKYIDKDPVELRIATAPLDVKDLGKYEGEDFQYHDLQFSFKPMGKEKATSHHATMEVRKMETQAVAWTRDFPHETPACWAAEDNRIVLAWDLRSETAQSEIKTYPALQHQADALKDKKKGFLLDTVAPDTGAPLEQVVIPEADLSGGFNDSRRAMISGEFVLVKGERGNTVIYRIEDGVKVAEFFGAPLTSDAASGVIAAVNRENEILLVDERNGKEIKRFSFASPIRLARIVTGKEKQLIVLTADQVVHRVPLPQ